MSDGVVKMVLRLSGRVKLSATPDGPKGDLLTSKRPCNKIRQSSRAAQELCPRWRRFLPEMYSIESPLLLHTLTCCWQVKRFALYEEYGARCEMMQDDVDFFQKTTLCGPDYDKAIEALCASLNPMNTREANKRKALSLKDLLIKVRLDQSLFGLVG